MKRRWACVRKSRLAVSLSSLLPALVAVALLFLAAGPASAQSVEKRLGQVEARVAQLSSQLASAAAALQPLPGQIAALTAQVSSLDTAVRAMQAQLPTLASQASVDALAQRVASLEEQVANLPGAGSVSLSVNCNAGETIQSALAWAGDRPTRVEIQISGNCPEDVGLSHGNRRFRGLQEGDGFRSLSLDNVDAVSLDQITLSGGGISASQASFTADHLTVRGATEGIHLQHGSSATIRTFSIQGAQERGLSVGIGCLLVADGGVIDGRGMASDGGVMSYGGLIQLGETVVTGHPFGAHVSGPGVISLWGGRIERNTSGGIVVSQGGTVNMSSTLVQENGGVGIYVDAGQAGLQGATIRKNGLSSAVGEGGGIRVRMSGALNLNGTNVVNNGGIGVEVRDLSSAAMHTVTITDNVGDGIALGSLSMMEVAGPNHVNYNGGWGLICASSARYRGVMNLDNNASGPIGDSCTAE